VRFQVGVGLHGFKVTCRPRKNIIINGPNGPETTHTPPLIAKFEWENGYLFDSEKAQKKYGWTDEEREQVENYLLDGDRNRYLNRSDLRKTMYCLDIVEERNAALKALADKAIQQAPVVLKTCRGWDVEANAPCAEVALEGIDYCKRHVPVRESA
jgi:hypothetical protein